MLFNEILTFLNQIEGATVVKRQKLEGGSQEDFTVAVEQLGGWMEGVESKLLPANTYHLSLEQLQQLSVYLQTEV